MTTTTTNGSHAIAPLAVDAAGAAIMVGISRRSWDRLSAKGMTPTPVRIGDCRRWSVEVLSEWVAHGCPARSP